MLLNLRRHKGITLVELLLAAAMLSLVCSMLFLLFVNCILLNEFNRNRTIAATHAQYILEDIKDSDFIGLEAAINAGNWDLNTAAIEAQFDPGDASDFIPLENEAIDTAVTDIGVAASLLDITVTVTWDSRGGEARTISLETLIAEP